MLSSLAMVKLPSHGLLRLKRPVRSGDVGAKDPTTNQRQLAIATLADPGASWVEIAEHRPIAKRATALFSRHNLKAADALQLASGLLAAEILGSLPFVTLDHRLADAARTEGLAVIEPA